MHPNPHPRNPKPRNPKPLGLLYWGEPGSQSPESALQSSRSRLTAAPVHGFEFRVLGLGI